MVHPSHIVSRSATLTLLAAVCVLMGTARLPAQPPANGEVDSGEVQLTLPPETELMVLIDYVSQRLGIRFLYDEAIQGQSVSVRAPTAIPTDSLLEVLESALKMKGFALVDAEVEGWKKVTRASELASVAVPAGDRPLSDFFGAKAITQVFKLKNTTAAKVDPIIKGCDRRPAVRY